MIETDRFACVEVASAAELRAWLAAHHAQPDSVWLVTWRKHVAGRHVSTGAVLDELLAFGWIDGIRRKLDGDRTMQLISPRRTQRWAKSYRDRAARLEAEGRMADPGRAAVAAAKAAGLWDTLPDVEALEVPGDLAAALAAAGAADRFEASAPSYRRNVLRWIALAKRPATRAARIARTVDFARRGERMPQM
jgi:uncharacterized protein YdeI (YjbR/CyaY-like superfamily)